MVVTGGDGRVLFCSPTTPGRCADITHARQLGLVKLLADGPTVEILADAGYQGLGAQTGGRVVTPPHRKFKKSAPDWYEEMHERQRKAHSSRRIRVEHGIAHMKNWRALARHLGRREHMSDIVRAVAGLLSHQQTADTRSEHRAPLPSPAPHCLPCTSSFGKTPANGPEQSVDPDKSDRHAGSPRIAAFSQQLGRHLG